MRHKLYQFIAIVGILCSSTEFLLAGTVSKEVAKAKAIEFLTKSANKAPSRGGASNQSVQVKDLNLAYTSEKEGRTCFYVFNNGADNGFVIVGGDDAAKEILAYSNKGHFDYDKAPENFKGWLSQYTEQISLSYPVSQSPEITAASNTIQKEDIADLISTTWNQGDPYNRAIPKLVSSIDGSEFTPPTGCVSTAVAQIMKYWNYPEHGIGQKTCVLDYSNINGYDPGDENFTPEFGVITHDIDFEHTTYDWANMLDNYTGEETEEQIKAVSTLMYHVGIACQAAYGVNQTTGAYPEDGMKEYFGYSQKATLLHRNEFEDQTWEEIIYSELKLGRPVLYFGVGEGYTGHEYIIHGYSKEYDMYKVNWGWGGFMDCYCTLTPVSGSTLMGFENNQTAVIKLQPAIYDTDGAIEYGDTFWADGLKYSIVSPILKTVEIIRPEKNETQYSEEISIPSTVSYQGEAYSVVGIGDYAFGRFNENGDYFEDVFISQISIPEGIRYIAKCAFIESLNSVQIPESVTHLGVGAFMYCWFEDIVLPKKIKEIPGNCFAGCTNLNAITIPEGVTLLGHGAFQGCRNMFSAVLPSSLKKIDNEVFAECDKLEILTCYAQEVPSFPEYMYSSPFSNTVESGYLLVPNESIEKYKVSQYWQDWKNIVAIESTDISAFGQVETIDGIEYKIIPSGAEVSKVIDQTSIITIPNCIVLNGKEYLVTSIGSFAFQYVVVDQVILPKYLNTIKSYAFSESHLKRISFNSSLSNIGSHAFSYCNNLEKLVLPDSLSEISSNCFSCCDRLFIIELPRNVKTIGTDAFYGCPNLFTIVCRSEDVPVWDDNLSFFTCNYEGTIYVPSSKIAEYKSSMNWKEWMYIKPLEEYDASEEMILIEDNGIEYRLLKHGAVVQRNSTSSSNVTIPRSINHSGISYDVVAIGVFAFASSEVTAVRLPSSIKSIMYSAFNNCSQLSDIKLPDGITSIGDNAFACCPDIKELNIPDSLKAMNMFLYGTSLEKILIPEGVKTIMNGSTFGVPTLKEIVFPSTIENLINPAFEGTEQKVCILNPSNLKYAYFANEAIFYVPEEYVSIFKRKKQSMFYEFKDVLPINPLISVTLSQTEFQLEQGNTEELAIDFKPLDATLKYLKWYSSDPTIATVDQNGIVTAITDGTATITATSMYYPDIKASCTVTVLPKICKITYIVDGEVYKTESIKCQTKIELPNAPKKEGHTFYRWEGMPEDLIMPDHDLTVTAQYAITGDVNLDEKVNITDAVDIVNDRLGYESNGFILALSDVNSDEQYTITDAIGVINIMYGEPVGSNASARDPETPCETLALRQYDDFTLAIDMNSMIRYSAFQFDIELPQGITLDGVSLNTDRCMGFAIQYNNVSDNSYKVVSYNFANEPLTTGNDILLRMNLSDNNGSDEVRVSNIHFSTCVATDVQFDDMSLSLSISGILNKFDDPVGASNIYYNIYGQRIANPTKGIYLHNGKMIVNQ